VIARAALFHVADDSEEVATFLVASTGPKLISVRPMRVPISSTTEIRWREESIWVRSIGSGRLVPLRRLVQEARMFRVLLVRLSQRLDVSV
jgi:hypothetical protein